MNPFDFQGGEANIPSPYPGFPFNEKRQHAAAVTALHKSKDTALWILRGVFPIKSASVTILFGAIDFSLEAKAHKQMLNSC